MRRIGRLHPFQDLPDPRTLIRRTAEFISTQPEFLLEAVITYGAVQESGQTLHFDAIERVAVRRPDQLAWAVLEDNGSMERGWLSDGVVHVLRQPANLTGSLAVPRPIPAAVERMVDDYGLNVPFQDLLANEPGERWIGEGVTHVEYVGEEWVQGTWTHHLAVRQPGVDLEMWIRQAGEPFPVRMAIVFTEEEGRPSHTARFRRWSTTLPNGDATFEVVSPEGVQRVDVAPVARP
jgi:hypothetical protein